MGTHLLQGDAFYKTLEKAIDHTRVGITITDPTIADNPIVYANESFQQITGYEEDDIIGHNCRFLQGKETDKDAVYQIKRAVENADSIEITILNYRKDGTPFWNELHIDPVYVESEDKTYFIGIQHDVTKQKETEEQLKTSEDEVMALSTPIVSIAEGVSVLPLVGSMSKERIDTISDHITEKISRNREETLIVELSGIRDFNEEVIRGIYRLHDLLNLLGTTLIISGIQPEFAAQSAKLQMDLSTIQTYGTVKEALKYIQ
ncbi:biphenyl 2,3-dioxygenase [Pontibacillus halophilus JSM 076056 = DSM 19796]|uniref:Biphenyl 2,3-dioxygenase n=1 Tax=Pontibacillus halophilus JSM 076056 = DSM 19796 TaxID=1385510 RepID=A0A0A5GG48_9BACI|nr:STAS domain-containing protein [Pontibacillus halophilus]KGX90070.1 biphenyl 2,3-dioxygenase [Pontibacillus halophilus JSM 076056 = DSM 19796]